MPDTPSLRVLEEPEPYSAGDPLLPLCDYIRRFMVMQDEAVTACALWIAHTYVVAAAEITPYLHILSPESQSGKTTLWDILKHLCARPWPADHVTAAALRRGLNTWPPPTFLLDEADPIFSQMSESTEQLRGVLNAGFRKGSTVAILVQEGREWVVRDFSVFSPKVLVSIKSLPDTIESRCIPIRLKRKRGGEDVERFRLRKAEGETTQLKAALEMWAPTVVDRLVEAEPDVPTELSGRQADCWESLLAIADILGGPWPSQARLAAVAIHAEREDFSLGVELLADIKEAFDASPTEDMYSVTLVQALVAQSDKPWLHAGENGRALDASLLAKMLRPFYIRPAQIRIGSLLQQRGYKRSQFEDAWTRY